jgi:DNA-binding transcriptional LysR family regulator
MEAVQLQLLEWVQQGTVDFSIVALPVQDPHLQSAPLLHDDFVLVVPKDHGFAARRIVKLAELVTERFILFPRGAGGREQFMEACRQVGFEPQIAFESEDRETILGLVAAGVGITLLPRIIAHHTRVDGPIMVDIVEPRLRREVGVVWRRNRYLPQSARNLIALLEEVVHHPV